MKMKKKQTRSDPNWFRLRIISGAHALAKGSIAYAGLTARRAVPGPPRSSRFSAALHVPPGSGMIVIDDDALYPSGENGDDPACANSGTG
jgi:hypothetical protein